MGGLRHGRKIRSTQGAGFQCSYCRIYNPPRKGGYKGQSHISALAQHLLTMLKFTLETETNSNPLFS